MSWDVMTILSRHFNVASASIAIAVVYAVLFYIGGFYDKFQTVFINLLYSEVIDFGFRPHVCLCNHDIGF